MYFGTYFSCREKPVTSFDLGIS